MLGRVWGKAFRFASQGLPTFARKNAQTSYGGPP